MNRGIPFSDSVSRALEAGRLGMWDFDLETLTRNWNAEFLRLHGIRDPNFSGTLGEWRKRIHPEDADKVLTAFRKAVRRGREFLSVYRVFLSDGAVRWLKSTGSSFRNAEGRVTRLSGIVLDVTENYLTEAKLEASRADLQVAEMLAGMGRWSWDVEQDVVTWTEGLYALFQMASSRVCPSYQRQRECYVPESWERLDKAVRECLASGKPYHLELEAIRADGSHFFIAARGAASKGADGKVIRLFGTVHDITEQKNAERRIFQANQELIRANARLQEALQLAERNAYAAKVAEAHRASLQAVMSHEIRTPLNAILGMASLLETTDLTAEQKEYIQTLSSSGHSLAALLNDILDFSKLEAGKIVLEAYPFHLLNLAHETLLMFAGLAREKDVELTYVVEPGFVSEVKGDFYRLK